MKSFRILPLRMAFFVVSTMLFVACLAPFATAASFRGLGELPGGAPASWATAISADGKVVVGTARVSSRQFAFRWTAQSGMVALGFAPGDHDSVAYAVTADGNKIVGDDPYPMPGYALIWDPRHGMRHLEDALVEDYGLDLSNWRLTSARGITPDGTTIVGSGINPAGQSEAWIADIRPPSLAISRSPDGVVLLWGTNPPGFVLEETRSLSSASVWSTVTAPVSIIGLQCVVTNAFNDRTSFFRLRKP